ncbi:organic hydroperoxide resistance protein [Mannheimia haemolytica]|uniref:organic hydroperoxide resistance protein n=1 Tax=Mannheimia haemolytica TaxID=75985 RepID=UPI0019D80288|nr:organic hydroperoxide resistance protein [Mannheimia haemolytica]MBF4101993.1 organic hydroperoxide resistance protein [Mannheimia haemolytica]ULX35961.1 organic hydroperoxide resistance protein [Mannheimia haemolytica]ULX50378.1 organic hydroperoxide resistance protein [Mannheimia haemolytica]
MGAKYENFYHTSATATGGRDGRTQVDDGSIGFDLVGFQNESGKVGTNPEQLFAMGYAACFDSAMNHVAPTLGIKPTKSSTTVAVGIGQKADGAFGLDLDITITVEGISAEEAKTLISKAHEVCPYSNATRGNVDVRLHVKVVSEFDL